jgi:hypothetical protein
LFIAELAHVRNENAAILVTRPDRSIEEIECFPKAFVAEMSGIEDQAETRDFL